MGFRRRTIILLLIFLEFFGPKLSVSAQGCSVGEGGPISILINDIHEGIIFDLQTTGVTGIEQHAYGLNIISPPYVDMALDNSRFVMRTNERFSLYEENEIERSIVIIVRFRCSSNNHLDVTTTIHLHDTNNHAPRFIPTDHYHYVLDAPVPPGYQVTGCLSELIARDVDLTTERIIFDIQQNPFFGITYSAELSDNRSKEFIAIVTTKTFIRNLPEEMTLTITATDVHGTEGEGSHTTSGKITIKGNTNFVLPNEPVFSKTIYNGIYTAAGQVELEEFISLQNGYDELVRFSVEETYKINFRLVKLPDQVNQIMIEVLVPLEEDILLQGSIAIEIIAEREFTSGASATVILQLPQVDPVQFESAHYDGTIENNNLLLSPLKLSQGYKDSVVTASFVETELSRFFSAVVEDNMVKVSMSELDQTVIDQNSFINLQIVATARSSTATAVITLEIIKDDNVTPVFEQPIYTGTYDPNTSTGLAVQPIVFTQGYDGVESVVLKGDLQEYFLATHEGPVVTVHVSAIPAEHFDLGRIVLYMEATKPRTVGAKATLIVTLPTVDPVQFESAHYDGTIENNNLLLSPLKLSQGYKDSVVTASFVETELSRFFSAVVEDNMVKVSMSELDQTAIDQNSFINLQIVATARSSTATAVITLEIIKDDNVTPVFEQPIYTGTYDPNTSTGLAVQPIVFTQGYDGVESVVLKGDLQEYFLATQEGPVVTVHVSAIPAEHFDLGRIVLYMEATKPRTVGAKATLIVTLPTVDPVQFESAHYGGTIENNNLLLSPLKLSQGYKDSVVTASFVETELSRFFSAVVEDNMVKVSMSELDQTAIDQNSFINLQIVATARSSTATAVIALEIIKDDNVTPVFEQPIYTGTYDPNTSTGLAVQPIVFTQGYDGVESVVLKGDLQEYFLATHEGPVVTVHVSAIPAEHFDLGRIVLYMEATKPRTVGAKATLIVTLPTVDPVQFESAHYDGTIENNNLLLSPLKLSQGYKDSVVTASFVETELSRFFSAVVEDNMVKVSMSELDQTAIDQNSFINLQIVATARSSTATAVITLEIIKDDNVTPVFEQPIYTGTYDPNTSTGLAVQPIVFTQGYDGVESVVLKGDLQEYFLATHEGPVVTVHVSAIPAEHFDLGRIVLYMEATKPRTVGAKATLIVTLPTVDPVQFESAHYDGTIENNNLLLSPLKLSQGYKDSVVTASFVETELSRFFSAVVEDNMVKVSMSELDQTAIDQNSFINLQIVATARSSTATAVITLEIIKDDNVTPVFEQPIYTGTYDPDGKLIIEQILFSQGYDGVDSVVFDGEHKRFFTATRNGAHVTIEVSTIPPELFNLGHIILSLQATKPRTVGATTAVIITLPAGSEPEDNVSFQNLVHRGTVQDNVVQHEDIRILGFDGTTIDLHGDYSDLFAARVTNGLVSVTLKPEQNLPAAVTRVALELHARSARAVLLLNVLGSGSEPEDNVSFQNLVHRGTVQDNVVQHEDIRILGFDGTTIDLHGDYSDLFAARVTNGLVSVTLKPEQNLPAAVTRVALELHARSARAVLLLNVLGSGSEPEDNVSFQNLVHRGTVQDNVVQHEDIRILGFDGTTIDLHGDYSDLFAARVTNGLVSVTLKPEQNLPAAVTRVALELHARSARAVLLLNVLGSGSEPEDNVSFQNLVHRGTVQDNVVQHEDIRILGFDGTTIYLHGDYSDLFAARVTNGLVSVTLKPEQNLPAAVTRVALELHARSARAVLLLNVLGSGSEPEDNVSFQNLVHRGTVQDNVVQHEDIRILGFDGTTIYLHGDYSDLFAARVTNGLVSVTLKPEQNLPAAVTRVALELHARSARAVLLLNVLGSGSEPEDNVSFQNLVHRGTVQDNVVQHEDIRILGFDGTTIDLHGDYSDLFAARVTNGLVSVTLKPEQNLPAAVTRVALELHARSARAVLLLNVLGSGSEPEDNVSFQNLVHRGTVQDNVVQHEDIRILGFDGTTIDLHGDYSDLFAARVTNGLVSVTLKPEQNLPAAVTRVALELHARSARAVLLLNVLGSGSEPEDNVSFQNLVHRGTVQDNVVQHEDIRILGFDGTTIDLHGDYSDLFAARVTNGLVSVTLKPEQNLPAAVTRVALELHARSARAVLLLNVLGSGSEPEDNVSFQNLVHRGTVQDNVVQHEDIRILGFDGTTIDLHGDYSDLFAARVTNGLVSVTLKPEQNLPAAVTRVALELHARSARAVLLLNVLGSGSEPEDNVSFQNLVHRGTVQDNVVQHEDIRILGFDGTTIDLHGDYSDLFAARVTNGLVSVTLKPEQNLPAAVTRVALELHARSARAVLLLNVLGSGSEPEDNVSFQNLVHRGTVQDNVVQHEDIRILGFDGTTIDLHGDYSDLFAARVTNGLVSVTLKPEQNLPAAVTRVALELHARSARAVLLLNVLGSGSEPEDNVSFQNLVHRGTVQDNVVQHEDIRILGFDGTTIDLHGDYSDLFAARVTNGLVSVTLKPEQNLPAAVTRVALELHARSARAVLLLNVLGSGSEPEDNVSFQNLVHRGTVQDNVVQHEDIRILGFDGTTIDLHGDYSDLFAARVTNGLVSVTLKPEQNLPAAVTRVALELHARSARAVLLLNVWGSGSEPEDNVSFQNLVHRGTVQDNVVQHEDIRILGFDGTTIDLHGDYSDLFAARVTNGLVSVTLKPEQNLPAAVTRVALELHARSARAVLLLNVLGSGSEPEDNVSFQNLVHRGTVQDNVVQHEDIRILGFDGTTIDLHGDYSDLFAARVTNGLVSVTLKPEQNLPAAVTRVALELHARSARAVLLLNVLGSGSEPEDNVSFQNLVHRGTVQDNVVQHEDIRILGFDGTTIDLHGDYSDLFAARVTNGLVSVTLKPEQNLPAAVTRVALELHARSARAVLLLNVLGSGSEPEDNVSFQNLVHRGTVQDNVVQHEDIRILGFDGTTIDLHGDYSDLFAARVTNGLVSVTLKPEQNLPAAVTRVALELHARSARAVLLLNVLGSGSEPEDNVSFQNLVHRGTVQDNVVQHEDIRILGFDGTTIDLHGDYSDLFAARVTNGLVSVTLKPEQNLSAAVTRVALELHARSARAVLLLNVLGSGSEPEDNVSFQNLVHRGTVQDNVVQHEDIRILGFDGTTIDLHGDYSDLFAARVTNGLVSVTLKPEQNLPAAVTRVALELHARSARAVLLLNVLGSGSEPEDNVSFQNLVHRGTVQDNVVQHEDIRILGFDGTTIDLHGDYSDLFAARVTNGLVSVTLKPEQNLPAAVTRVALELHARSARAVLLLNVLGSGSEPEDNVSFQNLVHRGTVQDNVVQHEDIRILGFDGTTIDLHGDYSDLFAARVTNGLVSVTLKPEQNLPAAVTRVALELHARSARAVLLLNVLGSGSEPEDNVSFQNLVHRGTVQDNVVQHEDIRILGFDGTTIDLHGDYSDLFAARVTNGLVSVTLKPEQNLPAAVTRVALELHARSARAVLLLNVLGSGSEPEDNVSFQNLVHRGTVQDNVVQHEDIRILGFDGTTIDLHGDYSDLFAARVTNGLVSVTLKPEQNLPAAVTRVALELHARSARAVLLLNVLGSGSEPEDNVSFQNLVHRGTVQDNVVQHEDIRILGFDGTTIDLHGDYSDLFAARVTNGLVSVTLKPEQNLPAAVTRVALELHARSARAVLLLNVLGSGSEPEDNVSFQNLVHRGTVQDNVVQHEDIRILGFDGTTIDLHGDYSDLFAARVTNGLVSVTLKPEQNLPAAVTRVALELHARSARAVLLLNVLGSGSEPEDNVSFQNLVHRGTVQDNVVQHEDIRILGFDGTTIDLHGDYSDLFAARVTNGLVSVTLKPEQNLPAAVTRVALELHARSARAVLLLNVLGSGSEPEDNVSFQNLVHRGTVQDNVVQHEDIRILGFDGTTIDLHGDYSDLFAARVTNGLVSVTLKPEQNLPAAVTRVALELHARSARAVLLLNVLGSGSEPEDNVSFQNLVHRGTVQDNVVQHEDIRILGFDGTTIDLHGDYSDLFAARVTNGLVSVTLKPEQNLPAAVTRVALELHARSARAVLLLNVLGSGSEPEDNVSFQNLVHRGTVQDNVVQHEDIRILGFDGTTIDLHGDYSDLFAARVTNGLVSVTLKPEQNLPAAVTRVALELHARSARAVLLLNVLGSGSEPEDNVSFQNLVHRGTVQDNVVQHEDIRILGFDGTTIDLHGDYSDLFAARVTNGLVSVTLKPEQNLPAAVTRVALELHARSARAVLLLNVLGSGSEPEDNVSFQNLVHRGTVQDNVVQHEDIRILGFDGTTIDLHGDYSDLFAARVTNGLVSVTLKPEQNLPAAVTRVALELHARSARAVLLLNVLGSGSEPEDNVSFQNLVHRGTVQDNVVQHEDIRILGFDGTTIDLHGDYSDLFAARVTNGLVSVTLKPEQNLPAAVTRVALELHARSARAVLLLNVLGSGIEPSVEFSPESYAMLVSTTQTGIVGRVSATSNNNEAITYSIDTDNGHLLSRLSINNEGELHLSAPVDSGVYTFQVVAATAQARATAMVHLTSQAATVCDDRGIVVPPLIVIDRDEEEEHRNLVVLDPTQHAGCRYTMTNRWPTQQSWLYVDETGLHTTAIDREHESIAFMSVSQVQVELLLQCDNDPVRTRRSKRSYDWLDPYEYGSNKWILTDSIPYNSRRTLVNVIVNDINDNAPIFVGKENEPIAVGYPSSELEERILPRSLAELQATDADIGINAALRYSSSESVLAVAPTTGFVHVRSGANLQHNQVLTVTATDQNGEGLSGTIQLVVKLLDVSHIAVVTVRDVFLDDEKTVLTQLSDAVGYEVKALRSVVVSDDINEDVTRHKRQTNARTSLQLYVYGLVEQEPVVVTQLTSDFNNQAVIQNVVTIPLETHLENGNTVIQTAVGLLIATIILSVLLFAALCVIAVWFFLRWRKNRHYNEFTDNSSLTSRNTSLGEQDKPEEVRPRLNIEELKKSEKRLQERLAAPMEEIAIEQMPRKLEPAVEAILDMPVPQHSVPIVIQSIDKLKDADDDSDNDEFGEVSKARRKSVVTFNENVEKIIHVQNEVDESETDGIVTVDNDDAGSTSTDDFAIYRL